MTGGRAQRTKQRPPRQGAHSPLRAPRPAVYASTKMAKQLWALIDWDADGTADKLVKLAQGLDTPQGMDWRK